MKNKLKKIFVVNKKYLEAIKQYIFYIRSVEDYEQDLRDVYSRLSRQGLQEDGGETAFLIEKTNQQSFVTLLAGTILTGSVSV